jgi:hypothetical protein
VTQLLWPAAAFCALCLGNLLMIERWSRQATPRENGAMPMWICTMLLFACVAFARNSTWFAAILVSAAGLIALARCGRAISGDVRCVLADAVLLTPLLFR